MRSGPLPARWGDGESATIDLRSLQDWEPLPDDEGRGDHVGRKRSPERASELFDQGRVIHGALDVGDEAPNCPVVLAHGDRRGRDERALLERGLDLAELDAEAADLHLVVDAAQVLERRRRRASARGRRCGRAAPPGSANGSRHEALGGQLGPVEVAARDAGAADVHLAGHADRHGPPRAASRT